MRVGYIGLGIMGRPCVRNLLKAGFEVSVWARRPASIGDLAVTACATPAELAGRVDVLVTNVSDTPDVESVLFGENGVLSGARPGSFMVGGEQAAFDKAQPVYQAMGKNIVRIGDSGAGSVAKACNQIVVALNVQAVAEAFKLADACQVDKARVREALLGGFASSRVLDIHGQRMIDDNYVPGFKAKLHQKDMGIVGETARALDTALPATTQVTALIDALVANGDGELDSSAIARLISAA